MTSLSTYDCSTIYTTLPFNLNTDKRIDLIIYLACNARNAFLLQKNLKKHHVWYCQNVCDALNFLFGQHFYSIWHPIV